jgi:hypothetical protein
MKPFVKGLCVPENTAGLWCQRARPVTPGFIPKQHEGQVGENQSSCADARLPSE